MWKFDSYEPNRIRIFRCSCVKNFRESYVFHCLVIKVVCLFDSLFTLSYLPYRCQELFCNFSAFTERRRRDLNPRAATNDLLPFQGSPFGQLGYFSIKNGEGGIRTHAPFRTNGFQDRLVMTTSIPLHNT